MRINEPLLWLLLLVLYTYDNIFYIFYIFYVCNFIFIIAIPDLQVFPISNGADCIHLTYYSAIFINNLFYCVFKSSNTLILSNPFKR